jgi:hypothetical protein
LSRDALDPRAARRRISIPATGLTSALFNHGGHKGHNAHKGHKGKN